MPFSIKINLLLLGSDQKVRSKVQSVQIELANKYKKILHGSSTCVVKKQSFKNLAGAALVVTRLIYNDVTAIKVISFILVVLI